MKRLSSLAAIAVLFLLVGVASAHTGSISVAQTCAGYSITARLNADVSSSSTWAVALNGKPLASGTGPGPADLGPYTGPVTTGSATLTIHAPGGEIHQYTQDLPNVGSCASPTASPTRPSRRTPTPTPPMTATLQHGVVIVDNLWAVALIYLGALIALPMTIYRVVRRKR